MPHRGGCTAGPSGKWLRLHNAEVGYDGVYYDIMGGYGVPAAVLKIWDDGHPETPYDEARGKFVRELRQTSGDQLIGGNMAHRAWEDYFTYIDYSHRESRGTSHRGGKEVEIYVEGEGLRLCQVSRWIVARPRIHPFLRPISTRMKGGGEQEEETGEGCWISHDRYKIVSAKTEDPTAAFQVITAHGNFR